MTGIRWIARIAVALALMVGSFVCGTAQEKTGPVGVAPEFKLEGIDGKQVRLSDYKGKVVLLDFWATWCVPCKTEVPRFVAFQNKYEKKGFQVIGLSMDDTVEPVRKFYKDFKMNYPVALGNEKVAESYGGVLGLPITFLIGRDGLVIKKYVGSADLNEMERTVTELLAVGGKRE